MLGERLTPTARVLLLVDYVETHRDFGELVETLNGLNESYAVKVRYAASCRTSYYSTVAAASRHRRVDLSPPSEDRSQSWLRSYREQTVYHILEQSGIRVPEEYLAVCRDIPVLAVFVTYLYSKKRELELAELLKEADFGIWVAKRIQLSFGETVVDRDLAKLMALFPIPTAVVSHPELEKYRVFFDRLATDGWIERLPPDAPQDADMWLTANDVLADQILLSYLQSIPHTADHFASELLSGLGHRLLAVRAHHLAEASRSALDEIFGLASPLVPGNGEAARSVARGARPPDANSLTYTARHDCVAWHSRTSVGGCRRGDTVPKWLGLARPVGRRTRRGGVRCPPKINSDPVA